MRIVFIGTVEFSKRALEKLIFIDAHIVGVFTKKESKFNADFADLKPICELNKIPCFFVENINDTCNLNIIEELKPDIIFCFGWSQILRNDILTITPMGVIGFHPAKLPSNRGRHPIIWALALGLQETASTFFFMDEGADSGDILSQKKINIQLEDDADSLYNKIVETALLQIEEFIPQLQQGSYQRIKQEHLKSNYWRKRSKNDGLIDFRMSSGAVYNLVRALSKPYVGAHVNYKGQDIIIWKVEISDYLEKNIEPGKILDVNNNIILVKTYDGAIKFLKHEFEILPTVGEYL